MVAKGSHLTEEHKLKLSKARKGTKLSEEHRRKISIAHKGMKYSKEFKEKARQRMLGKKCHITPHSQEAKDKMSESKLKNPCRYWKGKHFSKEHCEKIRQNLLGTKRHVIPHTEETKQKISIARKGVTLSEETKRKISESHKGEKAYQWISDRTKLKRTEDKRTHAYREWMRGVKNRDGWKCRIADNNCCGKLEAHHILNWKDFPELRYEVSNGITLCKHHHPRKRTEEKRLAPQFLELVKKAA